MIFMKSPDVIAEYALPVDAVPDAPNPDIADTPGS